MSAGCVRLSSQGVFGLLRFVGKILSLSWEIESVHEQSIVFTSDMKWSGGILLHGVWSSCSWLWTCRWRTQVNPQVLAALALRLCCLISVAVGIKRCALWDWVDAVWVSVEMSVAVLFLCVGATVWCVCVNVCDAVWLFVWFFVWLGKMIFPVNYDLNLNDITINSWSWSGTNDSYELACWNDWKAYTVNPNSSTNLKRLSTRQLKSVESLIHLKTFRFSERGV